MGAQPGDSAQRAALRGWALAGPQLVQTPPMAGSGSRGTHSLQEGRPKTAKGKPRGQWSKPLSTRDALLQPRGSPKASASNSSLKATQPL